MKRTALLGLGLVLMLTISVVVAPRASADAAASAYCVGAAKIGIMPTPAMITSGVPQNSACPSGLPSGSGFRVGAAAVTINPSYPVYMGGYGGGPGGGTTARHVNPLTGRPENFDVRAISIAAGKNVVEIARVDTQGYFAGYREGPYGITNIREKVAAFLRAHGDPTASIADVIVSALHEHASPTLLGIWGPYPHQLAYLRSVAASTVLALETAYLRAQPATLTWGQGNAPWLAMETLGQPNANEGWPVDGSLLALWARNARTGATIATYVIQPGYPNIVYGPGDLICPAGVNRALLSTDFPTYAQNWIQHRLGGLALVADSTLGNQPGPMQGDAAPSPNLPRVSGCQQTRGFNDAIQMGTVVGSLALQALGQGHRVTRPVVGGADQYLLSPITNPALAAIADVAPTDQGSIWAKAGGDQVSYPIDRSSNPPYQVGGALGTWVTGLRIGGLLILTEPGEFTAAVHTAWNRDIHGAHAVFVTGAAQDFLGYDYPAYNYPFALYSADEQLYNPALTLGDQVVLAGEQDAAALGFTEQDTSSAEFTALNNNYTRLIRPGVQLIAFPNAVDVGAPAPIMEPYAAAPRAQSWACHPPLSPTPPPACPSPLAVTMGPLRVQFGDGTATTAAPFAFLPHAYGRPGRYLVTVSGADSEGQSTKFSLPVTVHPRLSVQILDRGGRNIAEIRGGSGSVLLVTWTMSGGRVVYAPSIPAGNRPISVTVLDSTGQTATA